MEKLKDFLTKIGLFKITKYLVKKPYYAYRQLNFQKYSISILQEFIEAIEEMHFFYIPLYGTLLGFIRENKILNHDLDIDLGLLEVEERLMREFDLKLLKKGFKVISQAYLLSTKEVIEKSYLKNKVKIDIYIMKKEMDIYKIKFWLMPNNMSLGEYQKKNNGVDIYEQSFKIKSLYEKNINQIFNIKIPVNSEEILELMYGKNWKVSDKDWNGNEFYKKLKINEKGSVLI